MSGAESGPKPAGAPVAARPVTWTITWARGGSAAVIALRDDAVTLRSTVPSPPGSRIDGRTARDTPVRVKVHGCKKQEDGTFVIEGRTLDVTRDARAEIASLVPAAAPEGEDAARASTPAAAPVPVAHAGGAIALRDAREEDVPIIASLIRELAEFEKLSSAVTFDEADLAKNLFGERRYAEVTLAEVDGAVVGFALYFHSFSTFLGKPGLHLEDLFVRPDHRGKGIGKRLLARLARIAVDRGCGRLEWVVLDWNVAAIEFYRSLGAAPIDEWTVFRLAGPSLAALAGG